MAISLIFGLMVSTVLTLIIIPCSYAIVDGWRGTLRQLVGLRRDRLSKGEEIEESVS